MEMTLSIIKPDAVKKNVLGKIINRFEENHLKIVACKMVHLSKEEAERFYEIHRGKPFYEELVTFMSSGPVLVQVLMGDDAVQKNRKIMGATDPKKAESGTIRKEFATDVGKNAVHGSDSKENAQKEISFFFSNLEICI